MLPKISSKVSPFPNRTPTVRLRLRVVPTREATISGRS
jgi:hypothetical protein